MSRYEPEQHWSPMQLPGPGRLEPRHLRLVADWAERLAAERGHPVSVRDVLHGIAGHAFLAGAQARSPLALYEGIHALDALLESGVAARLRAQAVDDGVQAEYAAAGEPVVVPDDRASLLAARDMLRHFAYRGPSADPPADAEPPPRTVDVLVRVSTDVARYLWEEADRRAGPPPGPAFEPHGLSADGTPLSTRRPPTEDEAAAMRAHDAARADLGAVVEPAVRAWRDPE